MAAQLDDRMKGLLREIRHGKKSFGPADKSDEARREFDKDIKCLIAMRDKGLIPHKKLNLIADHMGSGFEYLTALVNGLSYEGELAADELDLAPAAENLGEVLNHHWLVACRRDFDRTVTSVASDPAQAIASASSTLESVCKAILAQLEKPIPRDQSMQQLIKETARALDLAPENAAEDELRRIFGAVGNIAAAVGTLRTKYGSAHGRTNEHAPLDPIHARFVVNAMSAVALFLLENAVGKQQR